MVDEAMRQTILVVDDMAENIDVLSHLLKDEYTVRAALNGQRALKIAREDPRPDLILLDVMMPGMSGYEVCAELKKDPASARIPVIFVTAMNSVEDEQKGFDLGAVDYITKPVRPAVVKVRVRTQLALYQHERELEAKVQARTAELQDSRLEIIRRLGRAGEYKDNETGLHVIRMSHYSRILARAYSGDDGWAELIFTVAPMHDVGKIGIPDSILRKPGRLDEGEWAIMSRHPEIGADIIGDHESPMLTLAAEIAFCHHEKWDGSGYPQGLKGEEIPISARIVALADVFDALTTRRPYKQAWSVERTLEHIDASAGSHFDPQLVELMHGCLPEMLSIRERHAEPEQASDHG